MMNLKLVLQFLNLCALMSNRKDLLLKASSRHFKDRETPLPLYIGLNIHSQTRSKKLLNRLHRLGISISYNCVIELENCLASSVCTRFEQDGVVCPSQLRKDLFTVGAFDNTDHNLSSTTAQGSFHGTGISIFQSPTTSNSGVCRDPIIVSSHGDLSKFSLPESYTDVPAITCKVSETVVPQIQYPKTKGHLENAKAEEVKWTKHATALLAKDKLEVDDYVSWAAFHAENQPNPVDPISVVALLPLFYICNHCHGQTWHECSAKDYSLSQSRSDSSNGFRSTIVCSSKICSVVMATVSWRRWFYSYVWRSSYQNGSVEYYW